MPGTSEFFSGKTIIITGAGSGIGRATALTFAREKANVVVSDIVPERAAETSRMVADLGIGVLTCTSDVTSREQVEALCQGAIERFGKVDFLFNSAGAAIRRAKFMEIDDALFDKTFDLNVKGTLYGMQCILPHMLGNGYGVIVNMASMAHKRGSPGTFVHYAAAKAAVLTMTLGVAREFAERGIRALSISPGPIRTEFQSASQITEDGVQASLSDVPMKRFGEAEEIAELVLFLCSDKCRFMTADTIYVNGGGGFR